MEEVTSNTTIAVMVVHLACHEEVYLGPKPKKVSNRVKGQHVHFFLQKRQRNNMELL